MQQMANVSTVPTPEQVLKFQAVIQSAQSLYAQHVTTAALEWLRIFFIDQVSITSLTPSKQQTPPPKITPKMQYVTPTHKNQKILSNNTYIANATASQHQQLEFSTTIDLMDFALDFLPIVNQQQHNENPANDRHLSVTDREFKAKTTLSVKQGMAILLGEVLNILPTLNTVNRTHATKYCLKIFNRIGNVCTFFFVFCIL